jgi:hypothetical protein
MGKYKTIFNKYLSYCYAKTNGYYNRKEQRKIFLLMRMIDKRVFCENKKYPGRTIISYKCYK